MVVPLLGDGNLIGKNLEITWKSHGICLHRSRYEEARIDKGGITGIASLVRVATICTLLTAVGLAQGLTGAIIGTVKDAQGGVLPDAAVRVSSPALIGGTATLTTSEKGQLRFPTLPPGNYSRDGQREAEPWEIR